MIEYGLRLTTGMGVPVDEDRADILFRDVIGSSVHPPEKRAIAANLSLTCLKRKWLEDQGTYDSSTAFALAEISCRFGFFSYCVLHLIQIYEGQGRDPQTNAPEDLWKAYGKYREETGYQRTLQICVNCKEKPKGAVKFKRCAGLCTDKKKPSYCSRECQKADWPNIKGGAR